MGVVLILACWASTMFYFFGRKLLEFYDVVLAMFTHFMPLGPIVMVVVIVALIVATAPKRSPE